MTATGEQARDAALQQVAVNAGSFVGDVTMVVAGVPHGTKLTGEQIRRACALLQILPHHHNAWGAAINAMVRTGLLQKTGRWTKMLDPTSHARMTPIYKVINGSQTTVAQHLQRATVLQTLGLDQPVAPSEQLDLLADD